MLVCSEPHQTYGLFNALKEQNTPHFFAKWVFFCYAGELMQLRAKHWGLQVKWWKKVERMNSAHLCFKKQQCEWLSQPSGSFLFVPPCLCPKTHLDAPYTFSSFISSISWFGHLNLKEIYHTLEAVFLEEGMNELCLLLQHVSCKTHRVPKSWSMLQLHQSIWRPSTADSKTAHKENIPSASTVQWSEFHIHDATIPWD